MKALIVTLLLSFVAMADEAVDPAESGAPKQKTNCKLTIKTTMKDHTEKVEVKEVTVPNQAACQKLMSKAQSFTDENIKSVNVEMSFAK